MSKFGWSLPPGCLTLPGESREEQEAEALVEALYEAISPLRPHYAEVGAAEITEDAVVATLEQIVKDAYTRGRTDAAADHAMAMEELKQRKLDRGNGP